MPSAHPSRRALLVLSRRTVSPRSQFFRLRGSAHATPAGSGTAQLTSRSFCLWLRAGPPPGVSFAHVIWSGWSQAPRADGHGDPAPAARGFSVGPGLRPLPPALVPPSLPGAHHALSPPALSLWAAPSRPQRDATLAMFTTPPSHNSPLAADTGGGSSPGSGSWSPRLRFLGGQEGRVPRPAWGGPAAASGPSPPPADGHSPGDHSVLARGKDLTGFSGLEQFQVIFDFVLYRF